MKGRIMPAQRGGRKHEYKGGKRVETNGHFMMRLRALQVKNKREKDEGKGLQEARTDRHCGYVRNAISNGGKGEKRGAQMPRLQVVATPCMVKPWVKGRRRG
ncbi:hypothetical protein AMTR_s00128p00108950 [Amborella trichopoda]|uniref:Uncharacterized protein n=1 Tax=Amborella trichopoda TaxID=13333 RepID=W1NPG4_AMBTC|nr:hypothetical protein AMTR_s00128p00108950 [Amborella trichopoda]